MKTPELRDRKTASPRVLTATAAALMITVFSSFAQGESQSQLKTDTLPVNKIVATVNVGLAGTAGLVVTPDSDILYNLLRLFRSTFLTHKTRLSETP
jgi:hypothetical protein